MSGTTEPKKSIFVRIYNWLVEKATAFKNTLKNAFGSIKNWFKSFSLFNTTTPSCCAGKKPDAANDAAALPTAAPQESGLAAVAVVQPTTAGSVGAPTAIAVTGVTALNAATLAEHNARQPQEGVAALEGSKTSSVTSKASK